VGGALTGPAAVDPRRIQTAYDVIRPHLRVTPVLDLDPADFGLTAARLVLSVAEPGAAAAVAALLDGVYVPAPAERVGVVISGANTTAVDFR